MERDGYFFIEDMHLKKRNGASFKGRKLTTGAKSCGLESTARSISNKVKTQLRFANRSEEVIKVFWLNYKGQRKLFKMLGPGEAYTQRTFVTHPWMVTNAVDACVGMYFPETKVKEIIIR